MRLMTSGRRSVPSHTPSGWDADACQLLFALGWTDRRNTQETEAGRSESWWVELAGISP